MTESEIAQHVALELDELVRERWPAVAAALEAVGERPCVAISLVERIQRVQYPETHVLEALS